MTTKFVKFAKKPLSKAVILALVSTSSTAIMAETQNVLLQADLDTIVTVGSATTEAENKDITGLGQIKKTAETLKQQQIESIRDLTRYDAGVAINESVGRGTSTGFSIRGAEKERVAVMVDGLVQGETIKLYGNGSGVESGAKNEVEYENLKLVEINKGVNSTYAGSGALGGAVLMQTKDASDFVSDNKDFGGRVKVGYTSKDQRKVASVGLGGRKNGWEGFVQYTKRKGHEIQPHQDIYNQPATIVKNIITNVNYPLIQRVRRAIGSGNTYNELDEFNRAAVKENWDVQDVSLSANELSGPDRHIPNPMNYDSDSLLSKAGYYFNDKHYLGAVIENTKQRYDVRNMFAHQYYSTDFSKGRTDTTTEMPIRSVMVDHSIFKMFPDYKTPIMSDFYNHTPAKFYTDIHHNKRYGLEYKYTPNSSSIVDEFHTRLDKQELTISSNNDFLNCTKWPTIDRNCDDTPKAGQYIHNKRYDRIFDTKRLDIQTKKNFNLGKTSHQLSFATGYKNTDYEGISLDSKKAHIRYGDLLSKNPQKEVLLKKAIVYDVATKEDKIEKDVLVNSYNPVISKKVSTPINIGKQDVKNKAYFVSLNDNIHVTDKLDISLGLRHDSNKFESSLAEQTTTNKLPKFTNSDFKNISFNLGLSYSPINNLELLYKYSTGFRVPSIAEQLGFTPNFNNTNTELYPQQKLNSETAKSHEIGANYYSDFGTVKASYFTTDYKDLIAFGTARDPNKKPVDAYFNLQSAKVHGFDVSSELDLNAIWNKVPLGLQANLSAGMVKMRENPSLHPDYITRTYAFDMIQPFRVIYGLSYSEPSDKWRVSLINTYSKGKDTDELDYDNNRGYLSTEKTSTITAPDWKITDLTGHYKINDNLTLRGGIYNLFNYRYLNWEALRQSKDFKEETGVDEVKLLAAPGRNYGLSMEFVF